MSEDEISEEKLKEIAEALNRVVDDLPWHQSVFLKALGKKFETIRDEFLHNSGLGEQHLSIEQAKQDPFALKEGQLEVFVSIYNAQGAELKQWFLIIHNLSKLSISRPTYSTEKAVREVIRSSGNILNEGYVSVHVNKADILPDAGTKAPRDKLGNVLLTLKENAIVPANIKKFYHKTGVYVLKNGELSRISQMNFSEDESSSE